MKLQNNTLLTLWEIWDYLSVNAYCLGCAFSCQFSDVNAELPRETELDILLNLFGQCHSPLKDGGRILEMFMLCVSLLPGTKPEAKTY